MANEQAAEHEGYAGIAHDMETLRSELTRLRTAFAEAVVREQNAVGERDALMVLLKEICAADQARLYARSPKEGLPAMSRVQGAIQSARNALRRYCDYSTFCSMPEKCAGTGRCQREICCAD